MGFVGCHANTTNGMNANNAKSFFISPPRINMMRLLFSPSYKKSYEY
jgi:hypothetical protein